MNGNGCTMSPNIDVLKDSSPVGILHGSASSRNGDTSPDQRLITNSHSGEFGTTDHSTLSTVPEGVEVTGETRREDCKTKYSSCSSSTPIKHVHRTPPSRNRSVVVTNPFDVGLTERLHLPMCSPSVFAHVSNPVQESPTFRWNIDNLSKIYPADIEEFPSQQFEETLDPEAELKAQDAINKFFCKSHLPSPWGTRPDNHALRAIVNQSSTPQMLRTPVSTPKEEDMSACQGKLPGKNVWTQTTLTLPPILPPSVELALKPFFTFTAEQQQCQNTSTDSSSDGDEGVMSTSSLRRKLFFNAESPSSTSSSPKQAHMSINCSSASSTSFSQSVIVSQGRTFGSPLAGPNMLSPLALSPVHGSPVPGNRPKSVTRLFNQEDMAVDTSLTTPSSPRGTQNDPQSAVCLSPLGTAPLHDKDTDDEADEAARQNNKWSRRNKRNLMDISSDSLRTHNCTPVKSMDTSLSLQSGMDVSQGNLGRIGAREAAPTYQEATFAYSQSQTVGGLGSQDTGYGSSCDGTVFQSGAASLFGLSLSTTRDKLGYEDSLALATPWQINPRNVVSSTPTKVANNLATAYQHD